MPKISRSGGDGAIQQRDKVHRTDQQALQQANTVLWTPSASKRFVITDMSVSVDTRMAVTLFDGTALIYEWHFSPTGGCIDNLIVHYESTTVGNSLNYSTSVAGNVSITINGYEK